MICNICKQDIRVEVQEVEETGGVLGPGQAHATCFWKRVAVVRLDRMAYLQDQIDDLRDYIDELRKPWWRRKLDRLANRLSRT